MLARKGYIDEYKIELDHDHTIYYRIARPGCELFGISSWLPLDPPSPEAVKAALDEKHAELEARRVAQQAEWKQRRLLNSDPQAEASAERS